MTLDGGSEFFNQEKVLKEILKRDGEEPVGNRKEITHTCFDLNRLAWILIQGNAEIKGNAAGQSA